MADGMDVAPPIDLSALIDDLRGIIAHGRGRAAVAVNAEITQTYWRIGERIVREEQVGDARATYRTQLLSRLGKVLGSELGRGFTECNLYFMRQFYLAYPILNAVRTELTWTHYRSLLRLADDQRAFYERVAVGSRCNSRKLDRLAEISAAYEEANRQIDAVERPQAPDEAPW